MEEFTWWGTGPGGLKSPSGVQGKAPVEGLGDKVPRKLKQNVQLVYNFLTFSCRNFGI